MSPYLKKLKQSLQLELAPAIHQTSKYCNLRRRLLGESVITGNLSEIESVSKLKLISGETVATKVTSKYPKKEDQEDMFKNKTYVDET